LEQSSKHCHFTRPSHIAFKFKPLGSYFERFLELNVPDCGPIDSAKAYIQALQQAHNEYGWLKFHFLIRTISSPFK